MRFEDARRRLERLPDPLPRGRDELRPSVTLRALPGAMVPGATGSGFASRPIRDAAALVLVYPDDQGEALLVLTVRPDGDHAHAGQVALPGGKREPGEDYPAGTALREAAEEVGLDKTAAGVRVVGRLDVVDVRVTGFLMIPVLAIAEREPRLEPHEREVARILRVPVSCFLPDAAVEVVEEERDGFHLRYGAYPIDGQRVWGATGQVLAQLGAVLGG
jgi:8-oxo-dGTP pyrophosphatase MutT (NUDIX family)